MNAKEVWLSNKIYDWTVFQEFGEYTDNQVLNRAYEMWSHAEKILLTKTDNLHLADAITTLKRSINQRLKFIEDIYNLNNISIVGSAKKTLENLESFGLIRPLMLKKIMEIRNNIEHNDSNPPEVDRCSELLDLTWYFLKSTDSILKLRPASIVYSHFDDKLNDTQYEFSADIDFENDHQITIRGWFPDLFVSETQSSNFTKILVETFHTKEERWGNNTEHQNKLVDDIWIVGVLEADLDLKHAIIKDVLESC